MDIFCFFQCSASSATDPAPLLASEEWEGARESEQVGIPYKDLPMLPWNHCCSMGPLHIGSIESCGLKVVWQFGTSYGRDIASYGWAISRYGCGTTIQSGAITISLQ